MARARPRRQRARADYVSTTNAILGSLVSGPAAVYSTVFSLQGCMAYYPACVVNESAVLSVGADPAGALTLATPAAPALLCDASPALASTAAAGRAPPLPWPNPPYAPPPDWPFAAAPAAAAPGFFAATNQSIACSGPAAFRQYTSAAQPAACGARYGAPPRANAGVLRTLAGGAAFTAHPATAAGLPTAIALATTSQCVLGDVSTALAAFRGPRSRTFYYTVYTHAAGALPAGSKCDAATARNATTEVFAHAYSCRPLATAINDDNTQTTQETSVLTNRGGSVIITCDRGRINSTIYASDDCSGAPASALSFRADSTCSALPAGLNGITTSNALYTSYISGWCIGTAQMSATASASPLRLRWVPGQFAASDAQHTVPALLAALLAVAVAAVLLRAP